jgi:hypothetical protein
VAILVHFTGMCDRIYIYSYILAGAQRDGIDLPPGEFRIILSGAVCVCVCVCVCMCVRVCVCVCLCMCPLRGTQITFFYSLY